MVSAYEGVNEVNVAFLSFGNGLCVGFLKLGVVGALAGEVFNNVGYAHLKHYVHTALEVEAEANLQGFAVLECFAEPYGLVAH